jgi:transcriptional regulator with XRE-family HTH domain
VSLGQNIGNNIERELRARKITQADLARAVDVAPSTVHAYIRRGAIPRAANLEKIAEFLGRTISELADDKLVSR